MVTNVQKRKIDARWLVIRWLIKDMQNPLWLKLSNILFLENGYASTVTWRWGECKQWSAGHVGYVKVDANIIIVIKLHEGCVTIIIISIIVWVEGVFWVVLGRHSAKGLHWRRFFTKMIPRIWELLQLPNIWRQRTVENRLANNWGWKIK